MHISTGLVHRIACKFCRSILRIEDFLWFVDTIFGTKQPLKCLKFVCFSVQAAKQQHILFSVCWVTVHFYSFSTQTAHLLQAQFLIGLKGVNFASIYLVGFFFCGNLFLWIEDNPQIQKFQNTQNSYATRKYIVHLLYSFFHF